MVKPRRDDDPKEVDPLIADVTLTIAVVGVTTRGWPWWDGDWDAVGWSLPYADRTQTVVVAPETATLGQVFVWALNQIGFAGNGTSAAAVVEGLGYTALYRADDDDVGALLATHLPELDEDGRLSLSPFHVATLAGLLRAFEAGVLQGDPRRPYLVMPTAFGDFGGIDWPTFVEGLKTVNAVVGGIANVGGASAALAWGAQYLRRRCAMTKRTVEVRAVFWQRRGITPTDLHRILRRRAWTTMQVSALLGCTEGEAEAILWSSGSTLSQDGQEWSSGPSSEAQLSEAVISAILDQGPVAELNELERAIRLRLSGYAYRVDQSAAGSDGGTAWSPPE